MAGETDVASDFELALIEVISDAGCLERSLTAAIKEARNTGHREEADALAKALNDYAIPAQDAALAAMDSAEITDAKHFAWANDPDGSTARELALARAAARSLQVHLERVAKFAEREAPVQEAKAEAAQKAAKAEAEKASVEKALEAARAAGAAAKAKAAAPAAATPAAAPAKAADAPQAAPQAAPGTPSAAPAKATPQVAKATPKK